MCQAGLHCTSRISEISGSVVSASPFSLVPSHFSLLTSHLALILLVDDDDSVRSSTGRLLTRAGYSVLDARSVREADERWASGKEQIDLLLTDQSLGDGDGVELLTRLRADRADLPVVLYSGQDAGSLGAGPRMPPGLHLLAKPFTRDDLLAIVRTALAGTLAPGD